MKNITKFLTVFFILLVHTAILKAENKALTDSILMDKAANARLEGKPDSSLVYYSQVYNMYNENMSDKEKYTCAMAYYWSAIVCFYKNDFTSTLELLLKGLVIIEDKCKEQNHIPRFYKAIADVYWLSGDTESAIQCYQHAYDKSLEQGDSIVQMFSAYNLAKLNSEAGNFTSAENFMQTAARLNNNAELKEYMELYTSGLIEKQKGNHQEAVKLFKASANHARHSQLSAGYECASYKELYKTFMSLGINDSTRVYLQQCYNLQKTNPVMNILPECLRDMSTFYKSQHDYMNAYLYLDKYYQLMDSVFKTKEVNRLRFMFKTYQDSKKEKQITDLKKEKKKDDMIIIEQKKIIVILVVIIVFVVITILYIYRQKQKSVYLYKKLFDINKEVMASEQYNRNLRIKYEQIIENREAEENRSDNRKYTVSKLKETQKNKLIEAIEQVMENTEEFCSPNKVQMACPGTVPEHAICFFHAAGRLSDKFEDIFGNLAAAHVYVSEFLASLVGEFEIHLALVAFAKHSPDKTLAFHRLYHLGGVRVCKPHLFGNLARRESALRRQSAQQHALVEAHAVQVFKP